jgi:hypothetical protein
MQAGTAMANFRRIHQQNTGELISVCFCDSVLERVGPENFIAKKLQKQFKQS